MATTNTTADEKILDRVAKLLALAEHPNTPGPEAEIALLQANKLIAKHAIEEALLRQHQTVGERRALVNKQIVVGAGSGFSSTLRTVLHYAADANRVSVAFLTNGSAVLFGADEDVAWVEMLFSMIKLQFLMKIEPKWQEALSYDENVYNFKVAGYSWAAINDVSVKAGGRDARKWVTTRGRINNVSEFPEDPETEPVWEPLYSWDKSEFRNVQVEDEDHEGTIAWGSWEAPTEKLGGILIAAYKRWAANIGDDSPVTTQSHRAYRRTYADAFSARMAQRFLKMKEENEAEMDTIPGAALAIRDMRKEAKEAMWDMFPDLSPEAAAARRKAEYERQQREDAERQAMLDAMTPKQREAFLEKEERAKRRQDEKYWRDLQRGPRADQGARRRGEAAANSVDLSRKAGHTEAGATRGELG
ncbi:hypothetical protein SEA_RIE18_60 [Microbacterium phage Rie18]|nr:hypothetical protein SEA_RIE18_60 [Microbacterium phage Rie18]